MNVVCLDMEGTLTPEIWKEFSKESGIPELSITTADEPDYDKLMKFRIKTLKEHKMGIREIQSTIAKIGLLDGAREFLDTLRTDVQTVIVSDTFEQFASPLIKKLGDPMIFCNSLVIDKNGMITDYKMRCEKTKITTVKAFRMMGYRIIAGGDSYNDIGMIKEADAGFLINANDRIKSEFPDIPAFENYTDFLNAIKSAL